MCNTKAHLGVCVCAPSNVDDNDGSAPAVWQNDGTQSNGNEQKYDETIIIIKCWKLMCQREKRKAKTTIITVAITYHTLIHTQRAEERVGEA